MIENTWKEITIYTKTIGDVCLAVVKCESGSWEWSAEDITTVELHTEECFPTASAAMANAEVWLHDYQNRAVQS